MPAKPQPPRESASLSVGQQLLLRLPHVFLPIYRLPVELPLLLEHHLSIPSVVTGFGVKRALEQLLSPSSARASRETGYGPLKLTPS